MGKRALECLIKVGALDSFGHSRAEMLDGLDQLLNASASHFRAAEAGQLSLFGGAAGSFSTLQLPRAKSEITRREMLTWEKELMGLYVSDHPLQPVIEELQALVTHYSQQLTEDDNGKPVVMAGVVTSLRAHQTKKGDAMGFVSVDDLQGHLELVVFPRTWREVSPWLEVEQIVVIQGSVDAKGSGQPKILVNSLTREFKLTRSAQAAGAYGAGQSREPAPLPMEPNANRPAAQRRVSDGPSVWDDPGGPPPWLDDELPLPSDDFLPDDNPPDDGPPPPAASAPAKTASAPQAHAEAARQNGEAKDGEAPPAKSNGSGQPVPVLEAVGAAAPANGGSADSARHASRPAAMRPAGAARAAAAPLGRAPPGDRHHPLHWRQRPRPAPSATAAWPADFLSRRGPL